METIIDEKTPTPPVINVAAALIEHNGAYLILKRAPHKENGELWEFPGGKLNEAESLNACVEREIFEELGVKASASKLTASSETFVSGKIIRLFGVSTIIEKEPSILKDHTEFRWVSIDNLSTYPLTIPDLGLLHQLRDKAARDVEFYHLHPLSLAKFYAVFNGMIGIFFGFFVLFAPFGMFGSHSSWGGGSSIFSGFFRFALALITPLFYGLFGGLLGALVAVFYNAIAYMIGGIKIKFR